MSGRLPELHGILAVGAACFFTMQAPRPLLDTRIGSIFHPSDFSPASDVAFEHALKIALVTGATLNILHAGSRESDWSEFPGVRATLERWRLLPAGSPRSAVIDLGIDVRKVRSLSSNPVKASLGFLAEHHADLIVLAVHQHQGRMRWLEKRTGEPIVRRSGETALFIPHGVRGFVSRDDGAIRINRMLIPVGHTPSAQPALEAAARLIRNLALPPGIVTLLHAGDASGFPRVRIPDGTDWAWDQQVMPGEPVDVILQTARDTAADLIMLTTDGPDGFLEGLRGSVSERVLAAVHCPLAVLPVGATLA